MLLPWYLQFSDGTLLMYINFNGWSLSGWQVDFNSEKEVRKPRPFQVTDRALLCDSGKVAQILYCHFSHLSEGGDLDEWFLIIRTLFFPQDEIWHRIWSIKLIKLSLLRLKLGPRELPSWPPCFSHKWLLKHWCRWSRRLSNCFISCYRVFLTAFCLRLEILNCASSAGGLALELDARLWIPTLLLDWPGHL